MIRQLVSFLCVLLANFAKSQSFGSSAAGLATVPEPSALLLAAAGLTGPAVCAWGKGK